MKGKIKERKNEMEEMDALTGLKKTRLHLAQISMEIMYKKVDFNKLICNNATEFGIQTVGHNNGKLVLSLLHQPFPLPLNNL